MSTQRNQIIKDLSSLLTQREVSFVENGYTSTMTEITVGTWKTLLLKSIYTVGHCQVFECVYNQNSTDSGGISEHINEHQKEVYYQLTGSTIFGDGQVLNPGEIRVIPPGQTHSCELTTDGSCIVIIHPPMDLTKVPDITKDHRNDSRAV